MKNKILCVLIILGFALLTGCAGKPAEFNAELLEWIRNDVDLPVYLPGAWLPLHEDTGRYIYDIDTRRSRGGVYGISAEIIDNEDGYNLRNPPAHIYGNLTISIAPEGYTDWSLADIAEQPDTVKIEIGGGLYYYEHSQYHDGELVAGPFIYWGKGEWHFFAHGHELDKKAEAAVRAWSAADLKLAGSGGVATVLAKGADINGEIINYDMHQISWEKDGILYSFTTHTTADIKEVARVLNSFVLVE